MPLQLLTAEEKVIELQQILESKDMENEELKVQLDNQKDQGSSVIQNFDRQATSQKNANQMQEILWLVNSAANDL